jgi:hypothetical protein
MVILAHGQSDDQSVVVDLGNLTIAANDTLMSVDLHYGNSADYESKDYVTTFFVGQPQRNDTWRERGVFPIGKRGFNASVEVLESMSGKLVVTITTDRIHVVNDQTLSGQMFMMSFPGMSQDEKRFPGSMFF